MAVPEVPPMPLLAQHLMNLERCIQSHSVNDAVSIIQKIVPNYSKQDYTNSMDSQLINVYTES
jgi:hypothetical protein